MGKGRLEAFSDGVIAIIITIMVLEMKVPEGGEWADLRALLPTFLSYVLSFIYVGIYWNNHHHLLHAVRKVSGGVLWANLHLLFWLSLFPFATGWLDENHFANAPTAAYGFVMLMASVAWAILENRLVVLHGNASVLAQATGNDWKGKLSTLGYLAGIGLSFVSPWLANAIYAAIALVWFVPDRRIEKRLEE